MDELKSSAKEVFEEYEEISEGVPPIEDLNKEEYLGRYAFKSTSKTRSISTTKYFTNSISANDNDSTTYGTECDLSETIYFPSIKNQIGNSCTSWATTYYQFTYEANKLNNINTKEDNSMAYSPVWTFNFVNSGTNTGAFIYMAYDFLEKHGALRIADCHYNDSLYSWSTKTDKMIEALNTRIVNDGAILINSFNASENLDDIKRKLYGTDGTDGKVLAFSTSNGWTSASGKNLSTGENIKEVSYRCSRTGGGHSMVIVGYDDDIWVDINRNGQVDENEKGAFKVANSWGASSSNNGFLWISYDALNAETLVNGNWEDELIAQKEAENTDADVLENFKTRIPAFQYSDDGFNSVYWMEVENKSPMYIGQLEVETDYRNSLEIFVGNNTSDNEVNKLQSYHEWVEIPKEPDEIKDDEDDKYKYVKASELERSYTGTLVFDYDDLCEPISDYIDGYNWSIKATGNHKSVKFKITDNLSNTIVDFGELIKNTNTNEYQADEPISLSMGDLNYDDVVDSVDSQIFSTGILSNLQKYLAKNMGNGTGSSSSSSSNSSHTIDYKVAQDWGAGQNIEITITNTGDTPIRNWALQCDNFYGTITTFWNCKLQGDNIIRCQDYNTDIPVGSSITMGYILTNATGDTPKFNLCSFRDAKQDGYSVDFNVTAEWDENFIGEIKITNTTDEPIMAWELNFDTVNFTISATNQFEILTNINQNYTITGTYNG
ncbi:MAG: cellulose binding domain-containing protein, partial [Oscillospiraceae bacterium]|nr:cellulose binding domain-containing protein [Oscillospiraceae bacterium]